MNIKKGLLIGLAALGLSVSAQASMINVGGVTWDPDSTEALPVLEDFIASGYTSGTNSGPVFGAFDKINNLTPTEFCPSCDLTFTITPSAQTAGQFTMSIFTTSSYAFNAASATDGTLWLELESFGQNFVPHNSSNASANFRFFDVTGGLAQGNFDTDSIQGHDFIFAGSSTDPSHSATFALYGDSIPEPTSIALLGLGLIGFAASRKRKA